MYAEEKEEEVKILERSVEELEGTVTVLEEEVLFIGLLRFVLSLLIGQLAIMRYMAAIKFL